MSKGLEALKLLGEMPKALSIGCETTLKSFCAKEFSIIEKELKALEIIKKYPNNRNSLANFRYMVGYWERNNVKVTKELLETYDFPFETDEYDLLKEVLL